MYMDLLGRIFMIKGVGRVGGIRKDCLLTYLHVKCVRRVVDLFKALVTMFDTVEDLH